MQGLVDSINNMTQDVRADYHLLLGQLDQKLQTFKKNGHGDKLVVIDSLEGVGKDKNVYPGEEMSYRGYYCDLAFEPSDKPKTVEEFATQVGNALGRTYEGYKGGDFRMEDKTPLWISEYSMCNNIAIMDVKFLGGKVVLITKDLDD